MVGGCGEEEEGEDGRQPNMKKCSPGYVSRGVCMGEQGSFEVVLTQSFRLKNDDYTKSLSYICLLTFHDFFLKYRFCSLYCYTNNIYDSY